MKKLIFLGVLVAWSLGSCNSQSDHGHEGHDHATEVPTRKQATATTMKQTHMLKKKDTPKPPRTKSSCLPPRHRPQA